MDLQTIWITYLPLLRSYLQAVLLGDASILQLSNGILQHKPGLKMVLSYEPDGVNHMAPTVNGSSLITGHTPTHPFPEASPDPNLTLAQTLDLTQGRVGMWPTTEQGPKFQATLGRFLVCCQVRSVVSINIVICSFPLSKKRTIEHTRAAACESSPILTL